MTLAQEMTLLGQKAKEAARLLAKASPAAKNAALTRLAALILIINMCVALFLVLGLSGWGAQELAAIYLLIYLTIFYTGPGKFSLDAWWLRRDCKIEVE